MKSRTFRLSDSDLELLAGLAERNGCSQTDALRRAIRGAASGAGAESGLGTGAAADAVLSQLAVKDEQIAALTRALESAQETAKAAQLLHAHERKALESSEQKRWRWPWSRG